MTYLGIDKAYLCGDCDGISDQSVQCICGSTALVSMERILGQMKSSYCSDYTEMHIVAHVAAGEA
jgi:hypothetical protein